MLRRLSARLSRSLDRLCHRRLGQKGFSIIEGAGWRDYLRDVGRSDQVRRGDVSFVLRPAPNSRISMCNTIFTITRGDGALLEEIVPYSHRGLLKLCADFDFESVLDVGSHEGHSARIFRFLGKRVTTTEILGCYEADYRGDYLDIEFPEQFDAIWASHILEHQRNTGLFLDKVFRDLKDGGVLAVTVPTSNPGGLEFGHVNLYTPALLIYQLVSAGFDCSKASVASYNAMTTVIVRKVANGISKISFAQYPVPNTPDMEPRHYFPDLVRNFPFAVDESGRSPGHLAADINW
jgi:SAM-dependent methyltransferase